MNIRHRILIYFSVLAIAITGFAFLLIFTLFSNYRREEFQQRIKDHTISTITYLEESQASNHNILRSMGRLKINQLLNEKTLLFNAKKQLIYSSLDDTVIEFSKDILTKLNKNKKLIESIEGKNDVVGIYLIDAGIEYYGISKAYDEFGYSKLEFLKYALGILYIIISALILLSSFILAKQITQPIISMAAALKVINIETVNQLLPIPENRDEIYLLTNRFNDLMLRLQNSFFFQKHAVHHISHELKTPISILVSNLEKLENENDITFLKAGITNQKEDTKLLGEMINALLEIAKVETHANLNFQQLRMDDVVFDWVADCKKIHSKFKFEIGFDEKLDSDRGVSIQGNERLMKMVIQNLLLNCVNYSSENKAVIFFKNQRNHLIIQISNKGEIISKPEIPFLFQHFFRGENSRGKRGFGLGLVLVNKILELHGGKIEYSNSDINQNEFNIFLPLLN